MASKKMTRGGAVASGELRRSFKAVIIMGEEFKEKQKSRSGAV
jgi:hypothetical protein